MYTGETVVTAWTSLSESSVDESLFLLSVLVSMLSFGPIGQRIEEVVALSEILHGSKLQMNTVHKKSICTLLLHNPQACLCIILSHIFLLLLKSVCSARVWVSPWVCVGQAGKERGGV